LKTAACSFWGLYPDPQLCGGFPILTSNHQGLRACFPLRFGFRHFYHLRYAPAQQLLLRHQLAWRRLHLSIYRGFTLIYFAQDWHSNKGKFVTAERHTYHSTTHPCSCWCVLSWSVCLSVRSRISKTTRPNFTKFLFTLRVAVVRSSAGGVGIHYIGLLPVSWMTSCFHAMGPLTRHVWRVWNYCIDSSQMFAQWQRWASRPTHRWLHISGGKVCYPPFPWLVLVPLLFLLGDYGAVACDANITSGTRLFMSHVYFLNFLNVLFHCF